MKNILIIVVGFILMSSSAYAKDGKHFKDQINQPDLIKKDDIITHDAHIIYKDKNKTCITVYDAKTGKIKINRHCDRSNHVHSGDPKHGNALGVDDGRCDDYHPGNGLPPVCGITTQGAYAFVYCKDENYSTNNILNIELWVGVPGLLHTYNFQTLDTENDPCN